MKGYTIKKVYLIQCQLCNEDITRTTAGDEPTSRAEAEQWARDHDKLEHPKRERPDA